MNNPIWWYVARASGLTAWALTSASVLWGLALSTRALRRPNPAWLLDLHRFLGGLALVFTGVHLAGLVADNTVHIGISEILVPLASQWRPGAVAWGVVGIYLLVAIEVTSLLRQRLPRRLWRGVHMASFLLFAAANLHLFTAGSEATNAVLQWAALLTSAMVLFLAVLRALGARGPGAPSRRLQPSTSQLATSG